jgi:hypothetical protein
MTTAFRTPDDINPEDIRKVADRLDGMKRGPIAEIWNVVRGLWRLLTEPLCQLGQSAPGPGRTALPDLAN